MTVAPETVPARPSFAEMLAVYLKPRVLIVLFLGFSAGLPLALSGSTLLVWMTQAGVDLGTIGLFALVGTPYTIKFLWAPVVDALDIPFFGRLLGRRRGWLIFSQLLLIAAIAFLAFCDPAQAPWLVALGALLVATASATQDIVIDAFRIESLPQDEQAAGMASYVAAYRIGMLASTAGALFLVTGFEGLGFGKHGAWTAGYLAMAALVVIGMITTLIATEPEKSAVAETSHAAHAGENALRRVAVAAYGAFTDFLTRDAAIVVLAFVVLYKLCDAFAGAMTAPFVIDLGFSRNEYATIVKVVGFAATLIGGFAGGAMALTYPLATSLWIGARAAARVELRLHLAGAGRRQHVGADGDDHCRELHRRDRHRDLRRLPVGAVPESAAHRDAICAAHRTRRGRAHLPVGRRRLRCRVERLADVLRHQRRDRAAEPRAARLAAAAGALRGARQAGRHQDRRLSPSRSQRPRLPARENAPRSAE